MSSSDQASGRQSPLDRLGLLRRGPSRPRPERLDEGDAAADGVDWRPVVVAGAMWGGMWLCTARSPTLAAAVGAVGGLLCLAAWRARHWLVACLGLVLLACVLAGWGRVALAESGPLGEWAGEGAYVELVGRVGAGRGGEGNFGQAWWRVVVSVSEVAGRGERWATDSDVVLIASGDSVTLWRDVQPGSLVRVGARLATGDDGGQYLVVARAREPPTVVGEPGTLDQIVERFHAGLKDAARPLAPVPRSLVPALVLGDAADLDEQLREDFKTTGLTHLTAVSGANLTILLGCLLLAAARAGVRGWWLRLVAAGGVVFFVLLCRGEPSVLRAAAMGSVGLVAMGLASRSQGLRFLSWSVVFLLLVDPWLCRSLGFALSVAATAGIVMWARPWAESLGRWLPAWLAEAVCVPLAAQLATQPIITAITGQVSVVGLAANLVAAPLVAPATVAGFAATALAPVWLWAARLPAQVSGLFAQGLCWIASVGASLPGAQFGWPVNGWSVALAGLGSLALVLLLPRVWASRWLAIGLACVVGLLLVRPLPQAGWPPRDWLVVSCDVGQGDATLIRAGLDSAILVDAGPDPDALVKCVSDLGVASLPLVVLTHLHADHVTGLPAVADRVGQIVTSDVHVPEAAWRSVTGLGLPMSTAQIGSTLHVGSASVEVLAQRSLGPVASQAEGESSDENDASLVMRASVGGLTVLLGGDVEESGQSHAVDSADLDADVILVPHHGSAHQDADYLAEASPALALISVGEDNPYGHPAPSLLAKLAGLPVFRTDQNGSVAVGLNEAGLEVVTQKAAP
ncbi:MAG: ComEC/Rec2 family competence protein [Propionibacteriaceae bacterium]|jgi:competence protein ComEC|nr:ComEC/Rec2 family competence protein [Propionibacteriaceae bacterium]